MMSLEDALDEIAALTHALDSARDERNELRDDCHIAEDALRGATQAIDDLNVQCKFWRQAAEHAVDGWNKLEDEHEALLETVRAIETLAVDVMDAREERAPPIDATPAAPQLQSLPGFTIVESEKRLGQPRLVGCQSNECEIRDLCTGHISCPRGRK